MSEFTRWMRACSPWLVLAAMVFSASAPKAAAAEPTVAPGDDFFRYANAEWLDATPLPMGKARWSARNVIAEMSLQQTKEVIRDPGASAAGRKISAFRDASLDEARIESKGLSPVAPLLKGIDGLRDKAALARWLGSRMRADVDPLGTGITESKEPFGFASSYGIHGEPRNIAFLVQGGLGMGDRELYLDDAKQAARTQYRDTVARVLQAAGFDNASQRADAVLALEIALARVHVNAADSGNEKNADNLWKREDFAKQAPGMDWAAFFKAAGLSRVPQIVAWQPGAITGTAALVGSEPLPVWKDYLRFHVLQRYADVLPRAIRDAARGDQAAVAREQLAFDATNQALPEAVGRIYVGRYFPANSKARVRVILDHVVAAFRKRVASAQWMSAESKRVALAKLDAMYFGVGYPDKWQDDSALRIDARDPVGNLQRVADWNYRNAVAKVGRPVDQREWTVPVQTPGGLLNFQTNAYQFTAALLQPPRFDPNASDATNYGSIGAIFGHETSHFVDTLGADYDVKGAAKNWWTAEDKARYAAATQPLVEQFSAIHRFPDLAIDGKKTLVENLADLGGLASAFDAYREAVGKGTVNVDALHRLDREFFLGYARSWRSKITDDALRTYLKNDPHAPDDDHVHTVRNLDAWYDAFDVQPGQKLYLAPEARVRVW